MAETRSFPPQTAVADARREGNSAVDLAEKLLGEALADDQRQKRLIDRFLSHIEAEENAVVHR